jgi:hypothetical protein
VYSGNDTELKDQLQAFLGNKVNISDGMETNAAVKALYTKVLKPFLAQDDILTVSPKGIDIKLADRCQQLFNDQLKSEDFTEELIKCMKDGFIYGISFMSLGWRQTEKKLVKKVITRTKAEDGTFGITSQLVEENVTIDTPDFRAEIPANILHPRVMRWKDLPYCIRLESVSASEFNARYDKTENELTLDSSSNEYRLDFERALARTPATGEENTASIDNEILLAHFYFSNEDYYVVKIYASTGNNQADYLGTCELVYEGRSPVAGLAIPIFPFIPEPLTGRLEGESIVAIAMQEQRKVVETDNLNMQNMRNVACSPIFYTESAGFNVNEYSERVPNQPIRVESLDGIKKLDLEQANPSLLQLSGYYQNKMKEILGATDFFQGNIGRSARLSSVDSLIGLATDRLVTHMSQFNKFILDIADGLVLLNRVFLPDHVMNYGISLYEESPTETFEIPYPLKFTINTPVSGQTDVSIKLGALREAVSLAMQQEQMMAGTWDINALIRHFFNTAGIKEIGRFMLKSPMTEQEVSTLQMMDSISRLMANSALPNMEDPTGMPMQPPDQMGTGNGLDPTGQAMQMPPINESSGKAGF